MTFLNHTFGKLFAGRKGRRGNRRLPSRTHGRRLTLEHMEQRMMMSGTPIAGIEVMEKPAQPALTTPYNPVTTKGVVQLTAANIISQINQTTNTPSFNASALQSFLQGLQSKLPSGYQADWWDYNATLTIPKLSTATCTISATINTGNSVQFDLDIKNVSGSVQVVIPDWLKGSAGAIIGATYGASMGGFFGGVIGGGVGFMANSLFDEPTFSFTADIDAQLTLPDPTKLQGDMSSLIGFAPPGSTNPDPNVCTVSMTANNIQLTGTNAMGKVGEVINSIAPFLHNTMIMPISSTEQTTLDQQADYLALGVAILLKQAASDGYIVSPSVSIDAKGNLEYSAALPSWVSVIQGYATVKDNGDSNGQITVSEITGSLQPQQNGGVEVVMNGKNIVFAKNTVTDIEIDTTNTTDTINIQSLPAGVNVDYVGGTGSNDNVTTILQGGVNINNTSGTGKVSLTVDDSADTTGATVLITGNGVGLATPALNSYSEAIGVNYAGISSLKVIGNAGVNFQVDSTSVPTKIQGGAQVFIGKMVNRGPAVPTSPGGVAPGMWLSHTLAGIAGTIDIQGNAQTSVVIDGWADQSRNLNLTSNTTSNTVSFVGCPGITYQKLASLALVQGTGATGGEGDAKTIVMVQSVPTTTPVSIYNAVNDARSGPAVKQATFAPVNSPWDKYVKTPAWLLEAEGGVSSGNPSNIPIQGSNLPDPPPDGWRLVVSTDPTLAAVEKIVLGLTTNSTPGTLLNTAPLVAATKATSLSNAAAHDAVFAAL